MFGRDQTLSFRARVGLLTRRGVISYDAPRLFNSEKWRFTLSGFYDNTVNVNTFTSERLEGSFGAEQRYSRVTTFLYRLSYQRVRVDPASLVIDPSLIPLYSRPVRIAMPSFTWVRDKRDNPVDTHKGSYNLLDTGTGDQRAGIGVELRQVPVPELDLLHVSQEVGVRAQYPDRSRTALWNELLSGRIGDGHSSAGVVLRRRRQLAARLRHQPGRPAGPADRLSDRRAGPVRQQL